MSPSRNFIRFVHRVDIYDKVTVTNDMGQKSASWVLSDQSVPCLYVRAGSSTGIRIAPTTDEADYYLVYFDHNVNIDYNSRLRDIRTKIGGEVLSSDWIQVVQIDKEISFTGKVQYLQLKVKSVIE